MSNTYFATQGIDPRTSRTVPASSLRPSPAEAAAINASAAAAASLVRPSPAASTQAKPTPGTPRRRPEYAPLVGGEVSSEVFPTGRPKPPLPAPQRETLTPTSALTPGRHAEEQTSQAHDSYGTDFAPSVAHTRRGTNSDLRPITRSEAQAIVAHANKGCRDCYIFARALAAANATRDALAAEQARVASADTRRFAEQRVSQAQEQRRAQADAEQFATLKAQADTLPAWDTAGRLAIAAKLTRATYVTLDGSMRVS